MRNWLTRQIEKIGSPELDWVQVEITTRCNAACTYCPLNILHKHWEGKHMSMETFACLIPYLNYTKLIYLQGWGEPLLNESLFDMIRLGKKRGKKVGFTTNGMLLNEMTARKLVDMETDMISVSLSGTTQDTHNRIRRGTDFNEIISNLKRLKQIKAEKKTTKPEIHLSYLMLSSNFQEISGTIPLAKAIEAKQVVASNLALILDSKLKDQALYNHLKDGNVYQKVLEEIKNRASRENILFDYHSPELNTFTPECSENIHRACVISVDGDVCPCVFTNPSLLGTHLSKNISPPSYRYQDRSRPLEAVSFGNIRTESLTRIWNKDAYVRFREHFNQKPMMGNKQTLLRPPPPCQSCYKNRGV